MLKTILYLFLIGSSFVLAVVVGNWTAALAYAIERGLPIWSDEFNVDGPPNPNYWSYDLGNNNGWGNQELETYTSDPENIRVSNGTLIITAVRKNRFEFTSARIKTLNKVTFQYGRLEASIKIPNLANGLWPAFWTLGNNYPKVGWPNCGELDIFEMGNKGAIADGVINRRILSSAHWNADGTEATYSLDYDAPEDLDNGFHNVTMNWTPDLMSTYLDGVKMFEFAIGFGCSSCTEFHQTRFIILNMVVGGTFTGIFDRKGITAQLPAEYIIDYIRIYPNNFTKLGGYHFNGTDIYISSSASSRGWFLFSLVKYLYRFIWQV